MKLLKFELRRLLNLKIVYIMFAVSALIVFTVWRSCVAMGEYGNVCALSSFINDAFNSSFISLFLALFVTIFNCQDGTEDTLKTIRARGYSSGKIYFAQLVVTYIVMLAYFVFVVAFAALMGFLGGFEKGVETDGLFRSLALQLYALIALTAVYSFFAALVKKTGGAIAVNVILYAMGLVAFLLIDMIIFKVATDLFKMKGEDVTFQLAQYWILQILSAAENFSISGATVAKIITASSVYLALSVGGGYLLSVKREIK